jgi:ABC-type glycerol-3-phosphate transport system substrate-binding protein
MASALASSNILRDRVAGRRRRGFARTTSIVAAVAVAATSGAGLTAAASNRVASEEAVTLELSYVNDPIGAAVIEAFEAANPNIDIDASIVPFSDYVSTIRLTMASDSAPDIAQYNAGAMRTLIPAGHLLPLDEFETSLGWDEKFTASSLDVLRTDEEARRFATGSLYAVPAGLSITGVYYNKELAAELGIEAPIASLDDFEAALAAAQEADLNPLTVGALDYNGLHLWSALVNVLGGVDQYRDWAYGTDGATIEYEGAQTAADRVVEWVDAGYIPSDANGISAADAAAAFAAGESLFHLDGNWVATQFDEEMGDNVGFFLLPMADGSEANVANGASVSWSLSAQTEHPEEAAMFLDFMASPEAAVAQVESGFMPVNPTADTDATGVTAEIIDGFTVVAENDGIMPFPDHPAPALLDLLTAGVQGLISGEMSSDEFLASLQNAWTEYQQG